MSDYRLTQEQINQFDKDGYLILRSFLSPEETESLLKRSKELLDDFDPSTHPLTKFTTGDDNHVGDDYFLTSGDKIRYFLETDAVDKDGKLNREKQRAVNKIGHGLHELDPAFRKITLENPKMRSVVQDLNFHKDPVALQSMVITKQPQIGGEVPEHNDSTFLYTNPPSALGFWLALERCTSSNGALSFLPGTHKTVPLVKRFVRLSNGGTGFESLVNEDEAKKAAGIAAEGKDKYVMETCEPGDLVLIHGSVLHKSERNTSPNTRFAYTFHMIENARGTVYDEKNWLQPPAGGSFARILGEPLN